jgi:hypothetical protein
LDTYDVLRHRVSRHHFRFGGGTQARLIRSPHRYIWPAEHGAHVVSGSWPSCVVRMGTASMGQSAQRSQSEAQWHVIFSVPAVRCSERDWSRQ